MNSYTLKCSWSTKSKRINGRSILYVWGRKETHRGLFWRSLNKVEELDVDGRILAKWISKEKDWINLA